MSVRDIHRERTCIGTIRFHVLGFGEVVTKHSECLALVLVEKPKRRLWRDIMTSERECCDFASSVDAAFTLCMVLAFTKSCPSELSDRS